MAPTRTDAQLWEARLLGRRVQCMVVCSQRSIFFGWTPPLDVPLPRDALRRRRRLPSSPPAPPPHVTQGMLHSKAMVVAEGRKDDASRPVAAVVSYFDAEEGGVVECVSDKRKFYFRAAWHWVLPSDAAPQRRFCDAVVKGARCLAHFDQRGELTDVQLLPQLTGKIKHRVSGSVGQVQIDQDHERMASGTLTVKVSADQQLPAVGERVAFPLAFDPASSRLLPADVVSLEDKSQARPPLQRAPVSEAEQHSEHLAMIAKSVQDALPLNDFMSSHLSPWVPSCLPPKGDLDWMKLRARMHLLIQEKGRMDLSKVKAAYDRRFLREPLDIEGFGYKTLEEVVEKIPGLEVEHRPPRCFVVLRASKRARDA